MKTPDQKIYLASKSPRRRVLLCLFGVVFVLLMLRDNTSRGPEVSEAVLPGEQAEVYVARVAREKADFATQTMYWRKLPVRPVLSADTTVAVDGRILGKPADAVEAAAMLKSLSDRTHQVFTSIAIQHNEQVWQATQCSNVTFAALPDALIEAYCATPEPYDNAGGYSVLGLVVLFFLVFCGCFSGIMG